MFMGCSGTTLHFCYDNKAHPTANRHWHSTSLVKTQTIMAFIYSHCSKPTDTKRHWRVHIHTNCSD